MIFTDQLNNKIELTEYPKRIVSIVPSQTELLHYLGLDVEVIGITKFCVHPQIWYNGKQRIGGTKNLNIKKIKHLNPDLIIGNKEENEHAQIAELQKYFPVWMSDIVSLKDTTNMIESIGEITNREAEAIALSQEISTSFNSENFQTKIVKANKKVVYIIWNNPIMTAGTGTFINSMLYYLQLNNAIKTERYPCVEEDKLIELNPDFIFLSSEPFPFNKKHIAYFQQLLPNAKIMLVDGEMFSWYGNRLLQAKRYFEALIRDIN